MVLLSSRIICECLWDATENMALMDEMVLRQVGHVEGPTSLIAAKQESF